MQSVLGIAEKLAEHPDARLRRDVLNIVPPGGAQSLAEILRRTKMRKRVVMEVLEGLCIDGSLKPHAVSGATGDVIYQRLR